MNEEQILELSASENPHPISGELSEDSLFSHEDMDYLGSITKDGLLYDYYEVSNQANDHIRFVYIPRDNES